jgi:hypothetical protein
MHEFGHAIDFAHEQNRFDTPGECQKPKQGTDGDLLLTPYDHASVMNYCNKKYGNHGQLSQGDIESVQTIYCTADNPRCVTDAAGRDAHDLVSSGR